MPGPDTTLTAGGCTEAGAQPLDTNHSGRLHFEGCLAPIQSSQQGAALRSGARPLDTPHSVVIQALARQGLGDGSFPRVRLRQPQVHTCCFQSELKL